MTARQIYNEMAFVICCALVALAVLCCLALVVCHICEAAAGRLYEDDDAYAYTKTPEQTALLGPAHV